MVQALLLDEYSRERLTYLQDKADFEERERRFQRIDTAFTQLHAPQSQPSATVTTTAATSNSGGGIFGMFNSQNFTTNTSANPSI